MRIRIILLLLMISAGLSSQDNDKVEYEERITIEQVPESILSAIAPFMDESSQVKYYREYSDKGHFVEVKKYWDDKVWSIKFDTIGNVIDVEELVKFKAISEETRDKISAYMNSRYKRFRFTRVQRQYTAGPGQDLLKMLKNKDMTPAILKYEIVANVKIRNNNAVGAFELLFDADGEILKIREIISRTSDNVDY